MIVFKIIFVILKLFTAFYGAFVIVYNIFAANDIPLSGKAEGYGYTLLTALTLILGFYINRFLTVLSNRVCKKQLKNSDDEPIRSAAEPLLSTEQNAEVTSLPTQD